MPASKPIIQADLFGLFGAAGQGKSKLSPDKNRQAVAESTDK